MDLADLRIKVDSSQITAAEKAIRNLASAAKGVPAVSGGNSADTARLIQAKQRLSNATRVTNQGLTDFSRKLREGAQAVAFIQGPLGGAASRMSNLAGILEDFNVRSLAMAAGVAGITFGLGIVATKAVQAADAFKQLEGRVKIAVGNTGDYKKVLDELIISSQTTGTSLKSSIDVFQRIASATRDMGKSNKDATQLVDLVQKITAASGTGAQAQQAGLMQFGQAIGMGVVHAEEFNSILENIYPLAEQIAAGMGMSVSQLKAMIKDGKVLSTDVFAALEKRSAEINKIFAELPPNIERSQNRLGITLQLVSSTADKSLGLSTAIAKGIDSINGMLETVKQNMDDILAVALAVSGALTFTGAVQGLKLLPGVVSTLTKGFAAMAAELELIAFVVKADLFVDMLGTIKNLIVYFTGATTVAGAFQAVLAALVAPLTVLAAALAAVGVAMVVMQKSTEQATGVHVKYLDVVKAFIPWLQVVTTHFIDWAKGGVDFLRSKLDELLMNFPRVQAFLNGVSVLVNSLALNFQGAAQAVGAFLSKLPGVKEGQQQIAKQSILRQVGGLTDQQLAAVKLSRTKATDLAEFIGKVKDNNMANTEAAKLQGLLDRAGKVVIKDIPGTKVPVIPKEDKAAAAAARKRANLIDETKRELEMSKEMLKLQEDGKIAMKDLTAEFDAQNKVKAAGIPINSTLGQQLIEMIRLTKKNQEQAKQNIDYADAASTAEQKVGAAAKYLQDIREKGAILADAEKFRAEKTIEYSNKFTMKTREEIKALVDKDVAMRNLAIDAEKAIQFEQQRSEMNVNLGIQNNDAQVELDYQRQLAAALSVSRTAYDDLKVSLDALAESQRILNDARKQGIILDASQLEDIELMTKQIEAAGKLKAATAKRIADQDDQMRSLVQATQQFGQKFEDTFIDALKTGKLNFKEFAASVLEDIGRMILKLTIMNALFGGTTMFNPKANNPGLIAGTIGKFLGITGSKFGFAQGGVISSPAVFQTGNMSGTMAENGPEAIMPLRRLSDGSLGVRTAGGGGGGGTLINAPINIQIEPTGDSERDNEIAAKTGKAVETQLRNMITQEIQVQLRPGNTLNRRMGR